MVQQLEITTHPMEDIAAEIETILATLRMELDVAPTDRAAHLDLLTRIKNAADKGQQLAYPEDEILFAISASKNDETWEEEDEDWYDPTELITIVEDEEEFAPEIEELRQKGWQILTKSQMSERVEQLRKDEVLFAISASKNDETWEEEDEDWYAPTELITIVEDEEEFAPEIEELRQKGWQILTKSQHQSKIEKLAAERQKKAKMRIKKKK